MMDYSKTPESLRPRREFSAMSFAAVNTVFRDSRAFTSKTYDKMIGLFTGPPSWRWRASSTATIATWSQPRSNPKLWLAGASRHPADLQRVDRRFH
ncbi:cytochrome P450 187A5 Cyp187A5 domain protein [Mycobacterium ulcerans str. Harvey]|uniref:Cytochrome P450 187A5 Cyp187A5 domain protein n=1 Tax=Mycobacterium ulcerans str. Harvey TaxID=1299332 RepID=A0ABN0QRD0_MYCUL|nr:cytochrome P450 187A5 Cyp187A5 domain protein [Mycobacterium ulcerans str. Harvey]